MASGLVLIGLLYTAHYLIYCIPQPFYIDAAISPAYARHRCRDGKARAAGCPWLRSGWMGLKRRMRWAVVGLLAVYGVLLGWVKKDPDVDTRLVVQGLGAWVKTRAELLVPFWSNSLRSRAWRARGVMWPVRPPDCSLSSTSAANDKGAPVVQPLQRGLGRDGGRRATGGVMIADLLGRAYPVSRLATCSRAACSHAQPGTGCCAASMRRG